MNNLTIIASLGKNRELGKNNELIWRTKEDMKYFRNYTMNKKIVMGINTFNSLPGLLPHREHIVLTRRNLELDSQVIIKHSKEELLNYLKGIKEEIMIIGGSQIYSQMLPYTNTMILTLVNETHDADVYFPEFNESDWNKETLGVYKTSEFSYKRVKYTRK